MLLLIGLIVAVVIAVLVMEPREPGTSVLDQYCSMEYTTIRYNKQNSCC